MRLIVTVVATFFAVFSTSLFAQNTSGVFGPVVDENERGLEYRASYDPEKEELNQRLHYQQSINGDMRWRLIAQLRETDESVTDLDYLRGELVWQLTPDEKKYQTGFRFETRYRYDERPGDVTAHWINQWKTSQNWTYRFILGASRQFSHDPAPGLLIQSRLSAYTSISKGPRLGVEAYSSYGSTADWLPSDEQSHQVGPFAIWKMARDWSLFTGLLIGATGVSDDEILRLRVTREF